MSIAHQVIRNVVHQRHPYCGRIFTGTSSRGRSLHSFAPVRFKILNPNSRRMKEVGSVQAVISSLGRNSTSFFIISRNESTATTGSPSSSETGEAGSTLSTHSSKIDGNDNSVLASSTSMEASSQSQSASQNIVESTASTSVEATAVAEPVQEALVFESIPEPPALPGNVDEAVLNALGEPTLASLGLAGWSPSGIVQQCLEFFHVNLGMPWWGSILTGTIIVRVLLFPLVVKSQRNAAKMQNNMPELQVLQAKMTEARQTGNALLSAKYGQDMMMFMKDKDISPFKSLLVPLAMAPVFVSCFFGLRKMANLPVESMKTGGLFWFVDLTVPDPLYLLPLITSVTVWITLEIGVDGMKVNAAQHGQLMKYFMRAIPVVMFPFAINFPSAILCYWVSTNAISLLQVSVLKLPAVREKLNIEPLRKLPEDYLAAKNKKGFKESFKDSWTNMKITREIEDRQRYDEISFKRAGKGPIPKTFKYDPTKVSPDALAAVQAKKK